MRRTASRAVRAALNRSTAPLWIAAAIVAAAGGIFAAAGAFAPASGAAPVVKMGDEVSASLYSITVEDVDVFTEVEDNYMPESDGEVILVLTVRMENFSDGTIGIDRGVDRTSSHLLAVNEPLLELSGITPSTPGAVWREDGSVRSVLLHPNVPAEVKIGWYVDEQDLDEATVALTVHDAHVEGGYVLVSRDSISWWRDDAIAQITLDLP